MVRLAIAIVAFAGCSYGPAFEDCEVTCAADRQCPGGLTCDGEGMCRSASGAGQSCEQVLGDAHGSDGSIETCGGVVCTAPADADSTCTSDNTCDFTCHAGLIRSGASCMILPVASMPTARWDLAAVAGPDGLIYALGGNDTDQLGDHALKTVEAYQPSTNTWATSPGVPTARRGLAAVVASDARIYAIGGWSTTQGKFVGAVEAYNPSTNTWVARTSLTVPRGRSAAAVGSDGRIYVFGGDVVNTGDMYSTSVATVEAYDIATDTWVARAPLPSPRGESAAVAGADGRIYVIGGYYTINGGAGANLSRVDVYDPATNTWTTSTPLSAARWALAAVRVGGAIYAIGGYTQQGWSAMVEAYDVTSGTWTNRASLAIERNGLGAAVGPNGLIYAVGGLADTYLDGTSTVEAYSPTQNTWSP